MSAGAAGGRLQVIELLARRVNAGSVRLVREVASKLLITFNSRVRALRARSSPYPYALTRALGAPRERMSAAKVVAATAAPGGMSVEREAVRTSGGTNRAQHRETATKSTNTPSSRKPAGRQGSTSSPARR